VRIVLKSKIHRATITHADLHYEGSIGIDARLLRDADILPYEQVHVLDIANGNRFETYAIDEPEDSGRIAVYGAAAQLIASGDLVIIMSYQLATDEEARGREPRIILVNGENRPIATGPTTDDR
jgi:aspartate 1-decarboxylase